MNRLPGAVLRHLAALRAMLVFTVVCGIAYPLLVTGIAQAAFKTQADGSLTTNGKGQIVGSKLLCQEQRHPVRRQERLRLRPHPVRRLQPRPEQHHPAR